MELLVDRKGHGVSAGYLYLVWEDVCFGAKVVLLRLRRGLV